MGILDFLPFIGTILDRVIPDPAAAAEAKLKVLTLAQEGELAKENADLQVQLGQIDINKIDAASGNRFNSGWRPFTGWVCGGSLALVYIPKAIFLSVLWAYQAWSMIHAGGSTLPPYPDLGVTDLIGLLGALLGMSTLRTIDKVKGVAT